MPRLVPAPISIAFSEVGSDREAYEREYHQLSESDDNPINQWLKLAKAKGETADTDPVLLKLIIELHNKVDALEMFLKNEVPKRVSLVEVADIDAIGFKHFQIAQGLFSKGVEYYGRLEMPVHPKRDVGIFFEAITPKIVKITKMNERDEQEWNAYVTARERVLIRELKEKKR